MRQCKFKKNRGAYKCQTFGTSQYSTLGFLLLLDEHSHLYLFELVPYYKGIPHMGYHLLSSFSMGISFSIRAFSRNSRDVSRCRSLAGTKG